MAKVLFNLGRWSYLHKWIVIVAWVLLLAIVGGLAGTLQKGFNDKFSIPGMPSEQASRMIERKFPDEPNPVLEQTIFLLFAAPEGQTLDEPQNMAAIDEVIGGIQENVGQIADDERLVNPVHMDPVMREMIVEATTSSGMPEDVAQRDAYSVRVLSDDGRIGTAEFVFDVAAPAEITTENRDALLAAMDAGREMGIEVEARGPGMMEPVAVSATSEVIGISVAFVVLIITFGSLAAAGLPLLTAVVGIAIGALGVVLMTAWSDVNSITPVLAVMIGLAVGIDYALFILSRYRSERARGLTREDAIGMATGTAGSSVVFAGLTVIVALAALVIAKIPFLSLMGISAAITVGLAVLISLTLLPALMAVFGDKIFAGRVPGIAGNPTKNGRRPLFGGKTMGRRWVELIHKTPGLFLAGSILLLVALSVPAAKLELALPSDSTSPLGSTQRNAIELTEEGFGPGRNAQIIIIADAAEVDPEAAALQPVARGLMEQNPRITPEIAAAQASFAYALDSFKNNMDVEHVQMIGQNRDRTGVMMLLTPKAGPLDSQTGQLITAVRAQQEQLENTIGLKTGVTGLIPIEQDITDRLSDAMPIYLSVVVGLAIVLLLLVFRSLTVPITAGLGFLLSVGSAFGLTVLFWQEGLWGLVHTPTPLVSFVPIFLIGVTFGLAMDYQVFLVSRMREHYTHSGGKSRPGSPYNGVEESVVEGFALGARVVTAAAIIMISVFVAFIGQPLAFVKVFGFALGAAVLFDAFVVRMTLIPASMFLLGRATWWMPKWMDRILPSIDVEGEALEGRLPELIERGKKAQELEDAEAEAEAGAGGKAGKRAKKKHAKAAKSGKAARAGKHKAGTAGKHSADALSDDPTRTSPIPAAAAGAGAVGGASAVGLMDRADDDPDRSDHADHSDHSDHDDHGDEPIVDATLEPLPEDDRRRFQRAQAAKRPFPPSPETRPVSRPFPPSPETRPANQPTDQFPVVHPRIADSRPDRDRPATGTPEPQRPDRDRPATGTPGPQRPDTDARDSRLPAERTSESTPERRQPEPAGHDAGHDDGDGTISVQDLINRVGGPSRPRRRRALWNPVDYDEPEDGNTGRHHRGTE